MVPLYSLIVPLYRIFWYVNLLNSRLGLVIAGTITVVPISIWWMKGYYQTISVSIEEAALIDGCTKFEVFYRLTLPLSLPAIAATSAYAFIISWNAFLIPVTFIFSESKRTIPVGLYWFIGRYGAVQWGHLASAALVSILPVALIFVILRKQLISGLTAGSIKE